MSRTNGLLCHGGKWSMGTNAHEIISPLWAIHLLKDTCKKENKRILLLCCGKHIRQTDVFIMTTDIQKGVCYALDFDVLKS
jgi:hypothetical protein